MARKDVVTREIYEKMKARKENLLAILLIVVLVVLVAYIAILPWLVGAW